MIYTCPNCKEKVDETICIVKANDDSKEELYCPYCDSKIASVIVNQDANASIKPEGFDIQDEYKIGARKLKVPEEPKVSVKDDEKIMIEELFNNSKTIKENNENLKSCNPLSDDEINSIIAEYKSDLIQENTSLNANDIQILVDEKEADLRFNLTKATQAIENGRQWLINRGIKSLDDLEEEYSVLGMFDKFC